MVFRWIAGSLNDEYLFQLLDGKFQNQVSHETDGLIFQPVPDVSKGLSTVCIMKSISKKCDTMLNVW